MGDWQSERIGELIEQRNAARAALAQRDATIAAVRALPRYRDTDDDGWWVYEPSLQTALGNRWPTAAAPTGGADTVKADLDALDLTLRAVIAELRESRCVLAAVRAECEARPGMAIRPAVILALLPTDDDLPTGEPTDG